MRILYLKAVAVRVFYFEAVAVRILYFEAIAVRILYLEVVVARVPSHVNAYCNMEPPILRLYPEDL